MAALILLLMPGIGGPACVSASRAEAVTHSGTPSGEPLALGAATGAFGLDLMRAYGPGNVVLSPDGVAAALALTGTGAVGRTAQEIARTLHLKGPRALGSVGKLQRAIVAGQTAAAAGDPEAPALEIANGLFIQQERPIRPVFVNGALRRFGAAPQAVDFLGDPQAAIDVINGWVNEHTNGLIPTILDQLPPQMALALANAIFLDADWKHQFRPSKTRPGAFHAGTRKVAVDFMHQTESLRYGAGPGYRAVALPYRSSTLSLMVVLPVKQRLGSLQHRLDGKGLARMARRLSERPVILSLPRFHLSVDAELTGSLRRIGMPTAFSGAADFSRIARSMGLKIAFVKHAADFTVDEAGTVAAAATAVGVTRTAADLPPPGAVVFNANRPFLFFLRDDRTGAILFAGRLTNPEAADGVAMG